MTSIEEMTEGMIDAGDGLFLDAQGDWHQFQEGTPGDDPNKWMWVDEGLIPLGEATPSAIIDPFLGIQEQYRGGNPIEAETWQEAVSKSLEGFMRANYNLDPIFNWIPGESGLGEGQFRMGTLQELANQKNIPGMFFDTTGPLARNINLGDIVSAAGDHTSAAPGGSFDPLLGFAPDDKFLGFEDVPLEQLEKLVGEMPGEIFVLNPERAHIETMIRGWQEEREAAIESGNHGLVRDLDRRIADGWRRQAPLPFSVTLEEAQARDDLQDFNDFIFKLNIERFGSPDQIIKASPESVLRKFFDLPQYRLLYGNEPGVLDPTAGPHERFRADPGYQWAQDEGMRQIQRNSAAQGLLESGATQRDLQEYGQGLADQNYQRWLGQQNALYTDWQNNLRGIATQGGQLSAQAGQNTLNTGFNLAGQGIQQGTNLANLFANQGTFGANAFLNTGAAQANTAMQAASLEAQIIAAQIQAQASLAAAQAAGGGGGGAAGLIGQGLSLLGGFL